MLLNGFLVFIASTVFDIIWTYCIKAVSEGLIWKASFTSGALILIGSFTTIEYIQDHSMVFFAAAGAFFGTFLVMKHDEKEKIRLDAYNIERNFNSQKG